ncbi:MAG: DUF5675 family protein [Candidatus Acidiferrales bacterium]
MLATTATAMAVALTSLTTLTKVNLTVNRQQGTVNSTPGLLDLAGVFFCYTLEPRKDQSQGKPYCIPAGAYELEILESPHFTALMAQSPAWQAAFSGLFPDGKVLTPHVMNVPGFENIEIHLGNFPKDTEGCCLVGETRAADFVGASDLAFRTLMNRLKNAPGPMTITYVDWQA